MYKFNTGSGIVSSPITWEQDGGETVELELTRPSPSELRLAYRTRPGFAEEGSDFSPVDGDW